MGGYTSSISKPCPPPKTLIKEVVTFVRTDTYELENQLLDEIRRVQDLATSMGVPFALDSTLPPVDQSIGLMQTISNATQKCQTESWIEWAGWAEPPPICNIVGDVAELCRLTRLLIIQTGKKRSFPTFCTTRDVNATCAQRCTQEEWKETLFCEICNGTDAAELISKLKLSRTLTFKHLEYNVIMNLLILMGASIARAKSMTRTQAAAYDALWKPSKTAVDDSDRLFVQDMQDRLTHCTDKTPACIFVANLYQMPVHTLDDIRVTVQRIAFVIGYEELSKSQTIQVFMTTLGVNKTTLLRLLYKVFEVKAITWRDLDELAQMLKGKKLISFILQYMDTSYLKQAGFSVFS